MFLRFFDPNANLALPRAVAKNKLERSQQETRNLAGTALGCRGARHAVAVGVQLVELAGVLRGIQPAHSSKLPVEAPWGKRARQGLLRSVAHGRHPATCPSSAVRTPHHVSSHGSWGGSLSLTSNLELDLPALPPIRFFRSFSDLFRRELSHSRTPPYCS